MDSKVGRVAVVIASKDGESTIADTIAAIRRQAAVFVVSDGSQDNTVEVARRAGAEVLELTENVGKPGAIFRILFVKRLTKRFDHLVIVDDDTLVARDFINRCLARMRDGIAIVVGQTQTRITHRNRWNAWLLSRGYAYWRYQVTMRRGQSAMNAMNCISGSNSMYRSSVLDRVVVPRTPYIVDDTYWTLETHRRKLGRIVYAPDARAQVQDPVNMRDWYRQNVRWLWGSLQGVVGHRVGTKATAMDFWYVLTIVDWMLYVLVGPVVLAVVLVGVGHPGLVLALYFGGYLAWTGAAAIAIRQWRLAVMSPAIIVIDWLYRATFIHAAIKTFRQPRVTDCRWQSPTRYEQMGRTLAVRATTAVGVNHE